MRTARRFTTFRTRLFTFSLIMTMALAVVIPFANTSTTLACPVEVPKPLRFLYTQSDRIVVARVGKSTQVKESNEEAEEVAEEDSSRLIRTALEVSSTLKGESVEPIVYVYHWTYGEYQDQITSARENGDTLLLFLNQRSDGDGYELGDMTYEIKKLSDADLKVYVKRIEELASIMKQETPDQAEIVEWLVRCAEEPATRWEGAIELSVSNNALQSKNEEAAASSAEASAEEQSVEAEEQVVGTGEQGTTFSKEVIEALPEVIAESDFYGVGDTHARLLTQQQKDRLTNALFSSPTLTDNDQLLISLVHSWKDARLVPFLLTHLRAVGETSPYQAANMMDIIARTIGDDGLTSLAEDYRQSFYDGAEAVVDESAESTEGEEQVVSEEQEEARAKVFQQRLDSKVEYFASLANSSSPK